MLATLKPLLVANTDQVIMSLKERLEAMGEDDELLDWEGLADLPDAILDFVAERVSEGMMEVRGNLALSLPLFSRLPRSSRSRLAAMR